MGVTQVIIGVPKEICPGEERVALTPANVGALLKKMAIKTTLTSSGAEALALLEDPDRQPDLILMDCEMP
ncbi:MAG: hypothetical protein ACPG6O_15235, partial [Alloalcanivorax venustensis]